LKKILSTIILAFLIMSPVVQAQFNIHVVGAEGGFNSDNLSSYLLQHQDHPAQFLALDAGSLAPGIQKLIQNNHYSFLEAGNIEFQVNEFIRNHIISYFISHSHLDHLSGMIIHSPELLFVGKTPLIGTPKTIKEIQDHIFNSVIWADFFQLGFFSPVAISPANNFFTPLGETGLIGRTFTLPHSGHHSSALLVGKDERFVIYLGDMGADSIEESHLVENLWSEITPYIQKNQLAAIMIEVSFANCRKEQNLFGHLTPNLLFEELNVIKNKTSLSALQKIKIFITHIKPEPNACGIEHHSAKALIIKEIKELNKNWQLDIVIPEQGQVYSI